MGQAPSGLASAPWAARSPCFTWTLWMTRWGFRLPGGREAKAPLSTPGDAKALGTPEERWECSACSRPARRLLLPGVPLPAASPGEVGRSANPSRCPGWGDRSEAHLPAGSGRCRAPTAPAPGVPVPCLGRSAATSAAAGTGGAGRGAGGGGGARRGGQGGREEPARGLSLGCGMGRQ